MSLSPLVQSYVTFGCPLLSFPCHISYLISSFPCQRTRLTRITRLLRRFRDFGQYGPVVFKSFVKPSCSSLSSPSLPFTVMRCSLEEIIHLHLHLFLAFSLSLTLYKAIYCAFILAILGPLFTIPSDCNASPHSINTTNARNQPPFEMAGVCFLSCTRCRTKRRRRLRDLPMSRNNVSLSSLPPG